MTQILRGDARRLPLADASVDLIVTSPPYWALRSYTDGCPDCADTARNLTRGYMERYCPKCQRVFGSGRNKCHKCNVTTLATDKTRAAQAAERPDCATCGGTGRGHYDGQIGAEPTPAAYVDSLIECTREWMRVLKPDGSMWVNLGDKYSDRGHGPSRGRGTSRGPQAETLTQTRGPMEKSLLGLPWRYAIRCIDELGLILRAEVIWSKPNGLPESVTDRVRRSHETWFHFTRSPRYFAAVDTIREGFADARPLAGMTWNERKRRGDAPRQGEQSGTFGGNGMSGNPLGKLPGSVWTIATQPLKVPAELGIDHFACVDTETEILTQRGWLRHDQVQAGDQAAGYDLDAGTARWTQVHAVHRYEYDGEIVAVEKRDLSMRLTPNHRAIVQKRHGRHGHRGPVQVVRADELTPQHFIPRSAAWTEDRPTKSIGVDLAALLGWVAAEGWINYRRVMLSQSLDANPGKVTEIDALVRRLGGDTYRPRSRTWRGRSWTDCEWSLPRELSAEVMRLLPNKRLAWDMLGLPEDERRALLAAFIAGDGHARADGRLSIFQDKRNTISVDVLQAIAVTLGYKTTRADDGARWVLYLTTGGRSVTLRGTNGTAVCEDLGRPEGARTPLPASSSSRFVPCPGTEGALAS